MSYCLSRSDCHTDAVAGVAHRFGNIGLWKIAAACATVDSFGCHDLY